MTHHESARPAAPDLPDLLTALVAGEAAGGVDLLREALQRGLQALIEAEATGVIGAERHERTPTRTVQRNGTRERLLATPAAPARRRRGAAHPQAARRVVLPRAAGAALLEPRRRIDSAQATALPSAVVMEAYVHGTSTRKVDDLVAALGVGSGVSKSTVSRIGYAAGCAELDAEVAAFRGRRLDHTAFPYVFCDATYVKARVDQRVVSRAVVVATGVTATGEREVLGVDVGDSASAAGEDEVFWTAFLRGLRARGLAGVQLVISDAHAGLKRAVERVLVGAAWQRCRVHFLRNALARVPKGQAEMVAATVRTVFAQPDAAAASAHLRQVADTLRSRFPAVAGLLVDTEVDLLAYAAFPRAHWKKVWSTNPLEQVNKEIKRRANVVGIFPNDAAVLRLVGAVLREVHDEWQVADRRYLAEGSMVLLGPTAHTDHPQEVTSDRQHQLPAA